MKRRGRKIVVEHHADGWQLVRYPMSTWTKYLALLERRNGMAWAVHEFCRRRDAFRCIQSYVEHTP